MKKIKKERELIMYYLNKVMLMCKDNAVVEFIPDGDYLHIVNKSLLPMALQALPTLTNTAVNRWLDKRALPISRENAKRLCNLLKVPQDEKRDLVFLVKALSLNDCYWLKINSEDTWETVNLFTNRFSDTIAHVALTGESRRITIQDKAPTPEATTHGLFAKCWKRENDLYLYKRGGGGFEVQAEYIASLIANVLNIPHVEYQLIKINGVKCTKCKNICNENIGIISASEMAPAWGMVSGSLSDWLHIKAINDNVELFLTMLIFDGLIGNVDRHLGNWGFCFDTNTNMLLSLHPLMDHNLAINVSEYADNPYVVEHPFIEGMSIVEAAQAAYHQLPAFQNRIKCLNDWYKSNSTVELFYKLYDREDELIYLQKLLKDITELSIDNLS